MRATRLVNAPIIHSGLCAQIGENLNGPSLIRVPSWIRDPLGTYYLYFAHHQGRYIRMAYADSIEGPWSIYTNGVLNLNQTQFRQKDIKTRSTDGLANQSDEIVYAHVASPDVHVDHETRTIRMYYHGLLSDGEQGTRLALSNDGLSFTSLGSVLGPPYFRVFAYDRFFYAISWGGELFRAKTWQGPFERGPEVLCGFPLIKPGLTIRHTAVLRHGDWLHLFYSCIGDHPEKILQARIDLDHDWNRWHVHRPSVLLQPKLPWEGAALPAKPSKIGPSLTPEHSLRDPCVFENYLLYCGAGESAIGLAKLE